MPDSFEELSGKQFIHIGELKYNGGDELECQLKAFRILSGISRWKLRVMNSDMVARCLEFVKWVFEKKATTVQLLPVYKKRYGPAGGFDNLKMKEFHFSERYYNELVYENKEESINDLIAVLYRKTKRWYNTKLDKDGDRRIAFNSNEVAYYAKKIARWPEGVKQSIFLWYHTCRQELIDNNPLVFAEPSKGFESQFDTGLYGMMRSLAGEKLGSVADIEEMYVHTAMLELGLMKEEEKYIESQQPKNEV